MKVCIIGSGIAGLISAAYLCDKGHEVTVFEQNEEIGGVTASFQKNGYTWDLGQLLIEGIGSGEPFGEILEELGILNRIKVIKDDRTYIFPDFEIRKSEKYEGIKWRIDKLKELFPDDSEGLEKYWKYYLKFMKLMTTARRSDTATGLKKVKNKIKLLINLFPFLPKKNWNSEKLMNYFFSSTQLQSVFISILADFFVKPSQFIGLGVFALNPEPFFEKRIPKEIKKNVEHLHLFSIIGGMRSLINALAEKIKENGGKIITNSLVTKIIVNDGIVNGLQLNNGNKSTADLIIASGGAKEIFLKLINKNDLTTDFLEQINNIELMDSVFMVHLGLNFISNSPKNEVCTYYYGTYNIEEGVDRCKKGFYHEGEDGFVVHIPSNHTPTMAPQGHTSLTIYTICPDSLNEGIWEEEKDDYADKLIGYLEKKIPGITEHILVREIMTPIDFRKITNLDHHAFGGIAPIMGTQGLSYETPIKNLWFVGAQSESGGGVVAVALGAYKTMKIIEKSIKE